MITPSTLLHNPIKWKNPTQTPHPQLHTHQKIDQAIVIESKEGITIKEYTSKIATLTNTSNIRFVSIISNNRICIFLATKQIAEHITNHKTINIKDITVSIRPLINKHKHVIISNVCPIILHETVEAELRKRDIKMTTKLSYLRAGMAEPGFSHIMRFRRQVYIDPVVT